MPSQPLIMELPVRGPFSLAASIRLLEGFAPAGTHGAGAETLALAFPVEGDWRTAGAIVSRRGDSVTASVVGDADAQAVRAQLMRLLSLESMGAALRRWANTTRWWQSTNAAPRGCARSASGPLMSPRRGRSSATG
jgi:hypothetical protein